MKYDSQKHGPTLRLRVGSAYRMRSDQTLSGFAKGQWVTVKEIIYPYGGDGGIGVRTEESHYTFSVCWLEPWAGTLPNENRVLEMNSYMESGSE
jgi:hypothetical protein